MASRLATLPGDQLLAHLKSLVRAGQEAEAELLAHLGEVDSRRLYLDEACSSMFAYCVQVLHFAEAVAYKRIAAARAARRHPELLRAIRRGDLHLTAVSLLAPELTQANAAELIDSARHRTAEEIRRLLADRRPRPDTPAGIRRMTGTGQQAPRGAGLGDESAPVSRTNGHDSVAPAASLSSPEPALPRSPGAELAPRAKGEVPLGGERYLVRFTAGPELHAQLRELRALMRHQVPDGDLGKLLSRAVATLLEQARRQKLAEVPAPRPRRAKPSAGSASRHIPAEIRRVVWERDGGRCTFVSRGGRRCRAREFLEFHHQIPWARAGVHEVERIALLCRAHNQHEARRDFGSEHMRRFEAEGRRSELDSNPVGAPLGVATTASQYRQGDGGQGDEPAAHA